MIPKIALIAVSVREALLVFISVFAIAFVPASLAWLSSVTAGVGFDIFARAAVDVWLLGHGVHFEMTFPPSVAAAFPLPGIDKPFGLSLAPLAFGLLTALLSIRFGRRTIELGSQFIGPITGTVTFALLNTVIVLFAITPGAMPVLWRAFLLPPLIFLLGVIVGARGEIGRSGGAAERVATRVSTWVRALDEHWRAVLELGLRGAAGLLASLAAFAALLLAVLVIASFPQMVALYEGLHAGAAGSFILTLIQLMLTPNFVLWVMSWLTGAGFAIGVGSSVSPLGTQLGLVPSLPIFGVIPAGQVWFGYAWLAVPVLAALLWSIAMRRRLVTRLGGPHLGGWAWIGALVTAVAAAVIVLLLAWMASGSAGPGRLSLVGIVPWQMAVWTFVDVGIGAVIGWLIPGRRSRVG